MRAKAEITKENIDLMKNRNWYKCKKGKVKLIHLENICNIHDQEII